MANVDDFARHLQIGYLPGDLATAITGSAADAKLLQDLVRGNSNAQQRPVSGTLVTSLNTLTGRTLTATEWQNFFRQGRIQPVRT